MQPREPNILEPFSFSRASSGSTDLAGAQIDLGPRVEVTQVTSGRFANAIQRNTKTRHARQVIRENMTSSFVLDLEPEGSATVCRGWRYLFFNDGPTIHTVENIREQLGYRGRWENAGGWVQLEITLDDSICTRVGEYSHLIPNHASPWRLRFLPIAPRNHPLLSISALVCQPTNGEPVFGEDEPHVTAGILPGRWIVLGAGNGLKISVSASAVGGDEVPVVRVEYSSEPVRTNAWERSF
jgi:hypothetical protein